jgi:hypothetical protein
MCENGFHKCGLFVSCLLLHVGLSLDAKDAMSIFISDRTISGKDLLYPSYSRYVHYYEALLRLPEVQTFAYQIDYIRFITIPNFDSSILTKGCIPSLVVQLSKAREDSIEILPVFSLGDTDSFKIRRVDFDEKNYNMDLRKCGVKCFGDVVLEFYSEAHFMFQIAFNTSFVENNFLAFEKLTIDGASDDVLCRTFDRDFRIEVYLHKIQF